jgi:hypothetical protein
MINKITVQHPRGPHMQVIAAVNNVGMCAHLLKLINQTMAESTFILRKQRADFVDQSPEGITIDEFINLAESMASELVTAEVYCPDAGEALSAIAAKLPKVEAINGAA